jgi:hypothetical protein
MEEHMGHECSYKDRCRCRAMRGGCCFGTVSFRMKWQIRTSPSITRYAEVCGAHGVVAACLVAVKQIMPDSEVTLLAMIKFRAKVRARRPIGPHQA